MRNYITLAANIAAIFGVVVVLGTWASDLRAAVLEYRNTQAQLSRMSITLADITRHEEDLSDNLKVVQMQVSAVQGQLVTTLQALRRSH